MLTYSKISAVMPRGLLAAIVIAVTALPSMAEVIVDSQGFEAPKFYPLFPGSILGDLTGQAPPPEPLPVGTWQKAQTIGGSTAVVQTAVFAPGGGSQAVRVDRGANDDSRWAVPVTGFPNPPGTTITIDWDMRVEQTVTRTGFGPFFGVEAYDATTSVGLLASLGVDAATGEVLYQQTGTGFLTAPGATIVFGEWNHFQIVLDYASQQFNVLLNGVSVANEVFVDSVAAGGLNNFTDAPISAFAAAGDDTSQALPGTAYFDNFQVVGVPEPGSLTLAALAILGGLCLRRRGRVAR